MVQYVNRCGVPAEEIINGECHVCGKSCDVSPDAMLDKRIWDLAVKIGSAPSEMFVESSFLRKMEECNRLEKAPKYVKEFVKYLREKEVNGGFML